MNAQTIVDKILIDARAQAAQTLKDAQEGAVRSQGAMDDKIRQQRESIRKQAELDAKEQESRMLRMAELDERKALLAAKRVLIAEAFDLALSKLHAMPPKQARAHYMRLLCSQAQGDEALIMPSPVPAWFDDSFLPDANQALIKAGRKGALTLAEGSKTLKSGFILRSGGLELNCSDEALLKTQRMALESAVAGILFP